MQAEVPLSVHPKKRSFWPWKIQLEQSFARLLYVDLGFLAGTDETGLPF